MRLGLAVQRECQRGREALLLRLTAVAHEPQLSSGEGEGGLGLIKGAGGGGMEKKGERWIATSCY